MICDLGDVVTVPFPFVDVAALKRRPAVVLSKRDFNEDNRHSICAMITTASRSQWARDVSIGEWAKAGLSRPCVIRWKIFTLPNENILKRLGALAVDDRRAAQTAAAEIFTSSPGSQ